MRWLWRWIGGIIGLVVVVVIATIAFVYSGLYNVSATYPDRVPVAWILDQTMTHSVQRHARGIPVPPLDDPKMVRMGFGDYRGMCAGCHGAPGVPQGNLIKGFNPSPPKLVEAAGDWKPSEFFWITKNGVRMTGMPGWGVNLSDDEIWAIVAFAQKLPDMTPEQYKALDRQTPGPKNR